MQLHIPPTPIALVRLLINQNITAQIPSRQHVCGSIDGILNTPGAQLAHVASFGRVPAEVAVVVEDKVYVSNWAGRRAVEVQRLTEGLGEGGQEFVGYDCGLVLTEREEGKEGTYTACYCWLSRSVSCYCRQGLHDTRVTVRDTYSICIYKEAE